LFLDNCKDCQKIITEKKKQEDDALWQKRQQEQIEKKKHWAEIWRKRDEKIRDEERKKLTETLGHPTELAKEKKLTLVPKYPGNEIRMVEYLNVDKKIISFFDGSNLHYYIADWVFAKTDLVKYPIFKGHYVEIKISNGNCISFLRKLSWKELQDAN
jgi:hypothetical protein